MPGAVNFATHTPGLRNMAKVAADVHPRRTIPRFAPYTFKSWFHNGRESKSKGAPVILWPDTFNNYFHPEVAQSATEVLEAAGFQVIVPREDVCCGRPLYDWGMLDEAKRLLHDTLNTAKGPHREWRAGGRPGTELRVGVPRRDG